jgi:hypothetical protein
MSEKIITLFAKISTAELSELDGFSIFGGG